MAGFQNLLALSERSWLPDGPLLSDEVIPWEGLNFEDQILAFERIYRREAYAQNYERIFLRDGSQVVIIEPIRGKKPDEKKINCHWVPYAEQGLGFLEGALNFLEIVQGNGEDLTRRLKIIFNLFVADLQKSFQETQFNSRFNPQIFNKKLEVFHAELEAVLMENDSVQEFLSSHSRFAFRQKNYLRECLKQARLWAPLKLQPKSFVISEANGDIKIRQPIIHKSQSATTVEKGFKAKLFDHYKPFLQAGRIIPTQLTDQSSGLRNLGPKNAWIVSRIKAREEQISSRVLTSGMYGLQDGVEIVGTFCRTQRSVLEMFPEYTTVRPAALVTNSIFRGGNKPFLGGGEKGALQNYQAFSEASKTFRFIQSPLFNRKLLGRVKDQSTEEAIEKCLRQERFKVYLRRSPKLIQLINLPIENRTFAYGFYSSALEEINQIEDLVVRRVLHAILAWKALGFNNYHKGHEPIIKTIFDQFKEEMNGERPIYHIWQLALSAFIHEVAKMPMNIQCKSGKDRTGLVLVCNGIMDKFYTPEYGFISGDKSKFEKAREEVILSGDAQLVPSVGGALGAHGIVDSANILLILPRVLGLKNTNPKAIALVSRAAHNRKTSKFDSVERKRLNKIKILLGSFESKNRHKYFNDAVMDQLGEHLSFFGGMTSTNSSVCANALKKLFSLKSEEDNNLVITKKTLKVFWHSKHKASLAFAKIIDASESLSPEQKADYQLKFDKSLRFEVNITSS